MRPRWRYLVGLTLLAPGLVIITVGQPPAAGDEPSRLGRLFRFGSSSNNASSPAPGSAPLSEPLPATPPALPISEAATPVPPGPTATPRIVPRPRVTRPVTESDPIITRITLNRSDDGNQFGMFLQVYADGTIVDSEGVHHVGQDALRPLIEALQAGDLYRFKGHCGAPATDYVESVQIIVFERSLGRLRANAFSYSGNPQGCDNAIRHLHGTLDNLQAKLVRTKPVGASAGVNSPAAGSPPLPLTATPEPAGNQVVVPLTAPN
jgi:hypothetical protein